VHNVQPPFHIIQRQIRRAVDIWLLNKQPATNSNLLMQRIKRVSTRLVN